MKRAEDTEKRAVALIERAGKALANGGCDKQLMADMSQLLAEVTTDLRQVRRAQEFHTRTIADLHATLRDVRRYHSRGMDLQMQQRIDTVAPENLSGMRRRIDLWAVQDHEAGTVYPMRSKAHAENFALMLAAVAEAEGREGRVNVIPSIWPEVEHWREVAEQEAAWCSEAQQNALAAMQQVDDLNEQIDQLSGGHKVPTRAIRTVSVYVDNCDGGRFVSIGTAVGEGEYSGMRIVAYRDAANGSLHFRSPDEFEECMTLESKAR